MGYTNFDPGGFANSIGTISRQVLQRAGDVPPPPRPGELRPSPRGSGTGRWGSSTAVSPSKVCIPALAVRSSGLPSSGSYHWTAEHYPPSLHIRDAIH
jgi:hypothetical protein